MLNSGKNITKNKQNNVSTHFHLFIHLILCKSLEKLSPIFVYAVIYLFQLIQSAQTTNQFLQNLLTTTPSSTHISDYRKQRRTDSRADKPATFPGFDLHEDPTTPSPRKRRRQAYSQLIRLFIQNTRDRLETIRDVIKDESELHFQLNRPLDDTNENNNDQIRFLNEMDDTANRQFIDLAFTDADTSSGSTNIEKLSDINIENSSQTYLNSLFAAVGYRRITTTTSSPIENDGSNIITRYVLSPLFKLWFKTRERFDYNSQDDENSKNEFADNSDDDIQFEMSNDPVSEPNQKANNYRFGHFNNSLPFMMLSLNNESNANSSKMNEKIVDGNQINVSVEQNNRKDSNDTVQEAASAFQKAFYKHTNNENGKLKNSIIRPKPSENAELFNGDLLIGSLFDGNSSNIQTVPTKKSKLTQPNNGFKAVAGLESNTKSFGENAGVLFLEIFGTVVGMTWKALSQIPNYLRVNNENPDA